MIRLFIAAASFALVATTNASFALDEGYAAAMQHQYGTYGSYSSYGSYNSYSKPVYESGYADRYSYDNGRRYGYSRYGYGYRCNWRCY